EHMGPNLTRCIEVLTELVNAYRLSMGVPIPPPARERLGPAIVGSSRPADPALGGWDDEGATVINAYAVPGRHRMVDRPHAEALEGIERFLKAKSLDSPTAALMELQANARCALEQF